MTSVPFAAMQRRQFLGGSASSLAALAIASLSLVAEGARDSELRASEMSLGLAVGPAVPDHVSSLAEFIEWARKHPNDANIGSPGAATLPHLLAVLRPDRSGATGVAAADPAPWHSGRVKGWK